MIELTIKFDDKTARDFTQLSSQFPKEMARANGRAASTVKRRMRSAMEKGGGTGGIPTFAPLHPTTIWLSGNHAPGGKLTASSAIVSYKLGTAQVVGWLSALDKWASSLQTAEQHEMPTDERHYMHMRKVPDVPSFYARPARPVVDPLVASVAPLYPKWFEGAAVKLINKSLAKQGFAAI